jgi:aminotransferase
LATCLDAVPRSGIRDFFEIVSTMQDVISLGIGEPDFDTPWHVREASIFALEKGATSYTSNMGLLKLREELAGYVTKQFGITYDPKTEILITVGVSEALDLAVRALVNPGDEIMFHQPCYVSYGPLVTFAHGVPVVVPTDMEHEFRLTRESLEKYVTPRTKALMLNYPNNPTGAALTREDARSIADFVIEHDLILITDEIYAELSYEEPHVSVASFPGMKERSIFLHGFSKAWAMTGFRLGYSCAPPEITEAMMKIHQYTMLCAPILSQEAAIEALHQPEEDIMLMRGEYLKRRNFLVQSFKEMNLPCFLPRGAFYAFPCIRDSGLTSKEFALRLLEEEKVAVVPGTAFGPSGEGFVRCAYATGLDDLKEAMRRMAGFLGRVRKELQATHPSGRRCLL